MEKLLASGGHGNRFHFQNPVTATWDNSGYWVIDDETDPNPSEEKELVQPNEECFIFEAGLSNDELAFDIMIAGHDGKEFRLLLGPERIFHKLIHS